MVTPTATQTQTLTFERTFNTTPEEVYWAFTVRDGITIWLADGAHLNLTVGGYLAIYWVNQGHALGEFTELEANRRVAFTWRMQGSENISLVTANINGSDGKTHLTFTHSGLPDDAVELYETHWSNALDNLKSGLESGEDTRITSRVIIGIIPAAVPEKDRIRLELEEGEGTYINQLLSGFSAQEAGLQEGDIITRIEGERLTRTNAIFNVITNAGKRVGDSVTVEYHRGESTYTRDIQLRGYPIPPTPTTYTALADHIKAELDDYKQQLDALFEGVSETEAAQSTAENEWSANEVLAHLILNERWNLSWIGSFFQGTYPDSYSANTPARIKGVTGTYGSNAALVAELKRSWDEVVAVIRHIPEENLKRPSIMWEISFNLSQAHWHTDGHFTQIRNALEAARTQ